MRSNSLSIVIPVRNTPVDLLDRCLSSVHNAIGNFHGPTDVIVIDDFSSTKSFLSYSDLIQRKYPDCAHRRLDRWRGSGGTRNEGVRLSDSQYILFVDADDVIYQDTILLLMQECNPNAIVFANHVKVDGFNKKKYNKLLLYTIYLSAFQTQDNPFLYLNLIGFPAIIPRSVFSSVGGYPECIYSGEHIALWGSLFLRRLGVGLIYVDKVLYEYQIHSMGNSNVDPEKHIRGKCTQFTLLWQSLGFDVDRHITYVGEGLPTLYVPVMKNSIEQLPKWAELVNEERWSVRESVVTP